ncbi:MAG TPA: hypothetical protein DEQ09_09555 [Bacteroidales bacterium]|nr:hypothetical protein [Bacteroidales bacterium]
MKNQRQIFIRLLIYSIITFAISLAAISILPVDLSLPDILLPCIIFPLIAALAFFIFLMGTRANADRQPLYTAGAVGLKFILTVIFAVLYFVVMKNTGTAYIILFFLLYLAFTIYLLLGIVKVLKIKSLKQDQA